MIAPYRISLRQRAFTLTEVLFALVILTVACLSTVLLLPAGLHALSRSRAAMYAALKAAELADVLAQPRRQWGRFDNQQLSMTLESGAYSDRVAVGHGIRHSSGHVARGMPDLEQVLLREVGTAMPVPPTIARRLSSPDGSLERVVAAGGILFYPEPFPQRENVRQSSVYAQFSPPVPELQRMVFAVVTPPQQNLLPNHPVVQWPWYEMYPFPPQARLRLPHWEYTARNIPVTIDGVSYPKSWEGPVKTNSVQGQLYQGANWERQASDHPGSPWDLGLAAMQDLCDYGYTPLWYKISFEDGTVSHAPNSVETGITNIDSAVGAGLLPPKPGGPSHWRGTRIQDNAEDFFADFPSDPLAAVPADALPFVQRWSTMNQALMAAGETIYDPHTEFSKRMPSLGMRRYYRELALRLYEDVCAGSVLAGTDPLSDDLTAVDLRDLHPARILAITWLAHAAMTVTGYQLPFIDNKNTASLTDDIDLNLTDGDLYKDDLGSNRFAAAEREAQPDGSLRPEARPTAGEIAGAIRVHRNMTAWVQRFTANVPYDLNLPRPANRQMMMDHPLFAWDLFLGGESAQRLPLNAFAAATNESFYPVVAPGGWSADGGVYRGFGRLWDATDSSGGQVGDFAQYERWREAFDRTEPAQGPRFWPLEGFTPADRCRLLVFWSVDWKSYADAETAPALPLDVNLYQRGSADPLLPEDHPESHLFWSKPERTSRNTRTVREAECFAGQWGADRNGNGTCDVGGTPPEVPMQAAEIGRFVFYDPISYTNLRR